MTPVFLKFNLRDPDPAPLYVNAAHIIGFFGHEKGSSVVIGGWDSYALVNEAPIEIGKMLEWAGIHVGAIK